ncbi:hypothetical protein [Streptomyces sp. NPDC101234]|uniref:phosphotriesterase family protein n=1 Tax=Streptomyces sp. NPDC101234 TaxID=3366138 RepID=UPI0038209459
MTELFVRELTEGIAATGIRAAFLKYAIEDRLTPGVERVLRAVAQAHLRTGAPITVHTNAVARTGPVAQDILRSEGADLGAVVVGHSGDTADLGHLHELIDNGSYVGAAADRLRVDDREVPLQFGHAQVLPSRCPGRRSARCTPGPCRARGIAAPGSRSRRCAFRRSGGRPGGRSGVWCSWVLRVRWVAMTPAGRDGEGEVRPGSYEDGHMCGLPRLDADGDWKGQADRQIRLLTDGLQTGAPARAEGHEPEL